MTARLGLVAVLGGLLAVGLLTPACGQKLPAIHTCPWLVNCVAGCSDDACVDACAERATPDAQSLYNARANCEVDAGCLTPACWELRCPTQVAACAAQGGADAGG